MNSIREIIAKALLSIPCPSCQARSGEPCFNTDTGDAVSPHQERKEAGVVRSAEVNKYEPKREAAMIGRRQA